MLVFPLGVGAGGVEGAALGSLFLLTLFQPFYFPLWVCGREGEAFQTGRDGKVCCFPAATVLSDLLEPLSHSAYRYPVCMYAFPTRKLRHKHSWCLAKDMHCVPPAAGFVLKMAGFSGWLPPATLGAGRGVEGERTKTLSSCTDTDPLPQAVRPSAPQGDGDLASQSRCPKACAPRTGRCPKHGGHSEPLLSPDPHDPPSWWPCCHLLTLTSSYVLGPGPFPTGKEKLIKDAVNHFQALITSPKHITSPLVLKCYCPSLVNHILATSSRQAWREPGVAPRGQDRAVWGNGDSEALAPRHVSVVRGTDSTHPGHRTDVSVLRRRTGGLFSQRKSDQATQGPRALDRDRGKGAINRLGVTNSRRMQNLLLNEETVSGKYGPLRGGSALLDF